MPNFPLHHAPAMLRYMRQTAGLTQRELARRQGIDQPLVSDREKGNRNVPMATLTKIADECGCDVMFVVVKRPA